MAILTKAQLEALNQSSFPDNTTGAITPQILRTYNTATIDTLVDSLDTGSFVQDLTSLNAFTQSQDTKNATLATYTGSNDTKWNTLGGQTGSYVTSAVTGSSLITASFSGNTLTFTKGDSSTFGVVIPDVSGSIVPAGTISGSSQITALGFVSSSVTGSSLVTGSIIGNVLTFTKGDSTQFTLTVETGSGGGGTIDTGSFATTGSNIFIGDQTITGSVNVSGGEHLFIKRSATGANNLLRLGATDNENNFAFIVTGSDTNPGQQVWGINVGGGVWANSFDAGVVFNSTVLATGMTSKHLTLIDTADNASSISGASGSLLLTAKTFTSASAHISASTATQVNLIFKNNSNTADTILSGSNNIFTNPAAPTAGFKRYFGGSGNIVLGTAPPQISGSMGFSPTMNNNIWGGTGASPTMRGPVSSSAWTISSNVATNQGAWNIGTSATLNAEKIQSGFNAIGNIGSVVPAVQAYKTPLSASVVFSTNSGTGQISMNCDSSSIAVSGNTFGGPTTINNSYFPATVTSNATVQVASSNVFGTSIINASGSDTTFTGVQPRGVYNSIVGGYSTIGLVLNGDNAAVNSSAIIGGGLVVTGSNSKVAGATANGDYGSAFFGRWNVQDGNRAISGPTVFAVGTGTSTSARKTGFLIDSGSNTFIEGTLNVSGSTTITGSLNVTSLIVSGSTQFNVGAFNSTITQSGSAAVSQSMTFNNTDITEGVTLNGGGTQLTLTNSGTYNIQFSAQLLAATGQDDVYIWLKKNGTNVSNTATKLVLSNNEANVAAWNFVVPAAASDYFELVWQSRDGHTLLSAATATGNIPAIPSVIVTVTQVR
jgi:hypothetical protein